MAKQTGIVRISGTVGNLTFAQSPNGDEVRKRTTMDGQRMKTDKRFKRTRENWSEFARAGKAAKILRKAFAQQAKPLSDRLSYSRLVTQTMKIVKSDPVSDRGQRQLILGDFSNLLGYEFNITQSLKATYTGKLDLIIDRAAGTTDISIPAVVPDILIDEPTGATHFKYVAACSELDWDAEDSISDFIESSELLLGETELPPEALSLTFPAASTKTIVVTLGIWFYQEVNGKYYLLSDGSNNAMAIVGVDNI